mgnify:CR=1 FL=1
MSNEQQRMHIVSNQITCNSCGDTIFSAHRHDMVSCSCGEVAVDGGNSYLRRVGNRSDYTEQSITLPEELVNNIVKSAEWAVETGRNSLGITYAVLRAIRDSGYQVTGKD